MAHGARQLRVDARLHGDERAGGKHDGEVERQHAPDLTAAAPDDRRSASARPCARQLATCAMFHDVSASNRMTRLPVMHFFLQSVTLMMLDSAILGLHSADTRPPDEPARHGSPSYEVHTMNQADIAWMLVSTALVLLMTPALAFFYGGLVRSKNSLNTMMMSFVSLGAVGVLWALLGYSLAFAPGGALDRRAGPCASSWREPRGQGHDPARAVHVLPGDLRDHHRRVDLRRHRRAHALQRLPAVHLAVDAGRLQPDLSLGVGF